MNVLFAYNGRIEIDREGNIFGNELNDTLVDRYSFFGGSVTFMLRKRLISSHENTRLSPFNSRNLQVLFMDEINRPKQLLANNLKNLKKIDHAVREHDIIIARLPSLIGRQAISYARRYKKPYFVEVVGCPWDALYHHSILGKLYAPYAYIMMKKFLKKAPFALYVTTEFLQKRYPSNGRTVGVSDVIINETEENVLSNRLKKIRNKSAGDPLILGTLAAIDVKYKSQSLVIRAISELNKIGYNLKYKIVGKGKSAYLAELIKKYKLEDSVEIIGQLKHEEVFSFLDKIDIYIHPSKTEGLSRALVEAMSRASPCIGSNAGGIPELIEKEVIFRKGNLTELLGILRKLDKQLMLDQARRNFEFAKKYSSRVLNIKRNEFYDEFLKSIPTPGPSLPAGRGAL